MKKTIVYLFVCLILTASAMTSCKAKIKYSFLNPITNICAIKIIYSNDDYELISSNGQARYTQKKYKNYVGYYYFNDDEFDELIDKYLSLGKS